MLGNGFQYYCSTCLDFCQNSTKFGLHWISDWLGFGLANKTLVHALPWISDWQSWGCKVLQGNLGKKTGVCKVHWDTAKTNGILQTATTCPAMVSEHVAGFKFGLFWKRGFQISETIIKGSWGSLDNIKDSGGHKISISPNLKGMNIIFLSKFG